LPGEILKSPYVIPQRQDGYYLIRIRSLAGDLRAQELSVIGRVAEKYGKGSVHITTRQGCEIHNIPLDKLEEAVAELQQAGILMGAGGPRVRTVMACPGAETCKNGIIETKKLAGRIDEKYFGKDAGKFKIAVCGCPNNCTKVMINDAGIMGAVVPRWNGEECDDCGRCRVSCPSGAISSSESGVYAREEDKCIMCGQCIRNCPKNAWQAKEKGYILFLGGTMGKKPLLGERVDMLIPNEDQLFDYLDRALEYFKKHGKRKERFGHTLERMGAKNIEDDVLAIKN
jgi:dissimilatory sulfite reductase (desulfoviridin) alpha/beta subunit